MKYIRTKNGIYRTTKNFVVGKEHYVAWHDFYEEIINQADTIEELCDEFVAYKKVDDEDTMFRNYIFDNYEDFIREKDYIFEHYNVYGAIWTDRGLIYVAKMNEEGELVLL